MDQGPQTHDQKCVKSEPILKKFTGKFLGKFVAKRILKLPPHLEYVATLLCEILMSANKPLTINYKVV